MSYHTGVRRALLLVESSKAHRVRVVPRLASALGLATGIEAPLALAASRAWGEALLAFTSF